MVDFGPENDCGKAVFLESFPVPRGTVHRLEAYADLLISTNQKFNLIADSTLPTLWTRHFLDSAQIQKYIPADSKRLIDMGSGAGLPGIILSILNPAIEVLLIESTGKKAEFLRQTAKTLDLNVVVRQERVEALRDLQADIITARALKPLVDLLSYAKPLLRNDSFCLFLKGQNAAAELTAAHKYWTFKYEKYPSITDPQSALFKIFDLRILRSRKQ